ncbi:MAG: 4Fe-4S binding protein [Paludibacteraceae bacterium]|jgi:2-oxoglutarate ferredoxin oxidoreductase subunit delta|nr:4Fe-4S binding protein [Paludibacteraceae bacterium]MDI9537622.1 4Fe-4S binding protein [Bacteroidota bacterium]OQC34530.1 MAG: 2-oxoglutarate-acceptor oxidoreductase subunit OorD [Bacteroidetes bacterium ADurb.Bin057]HHT61314.1 4Fe-4S binding protein [Bacteroidales bacterium]MBP9039955.1 4Fe-4S binding protein [Paludibacteraceae bacterium]
MAKFKGTVVVNTDCCKGCELCIEACPLKILGMSHHCNSKGYHYVELKDEDACIGCASCGYVCPDACLTIYKVKL